MPQLKTLRLHGNSFEGPIPSSFSNLTGLQELWICDLLNGSSSLAFISNMKYLTKLVLRNNKISDTIPPSLANNVNLTHLDLSFNNLTGQLPQGLFNLGSLQSLYLGNNSLSGYLPPEKSSELLNIDLSYNDFSGSLPSWASEHNLELNLVANNFIVDRNLPWGLNCLQKDVPCFRGSPVYYSVAINCGGEETTDIDGTVYEADDEVLSTASYYMKSSRRWAVSSVGTFLGNPNPNYTEFTTANFPNTSNPKLFQSARLSPSSLRYYGLALENGDYSVALRFAETQFPNDQSWWSVGRRIFDVYIQGILMEKDFDIRKAAGGRSFIEVSRTYVARVTDNFLEIHFFWAGKGTTQIPVDGYYGPSISAISITPNFRPTVANHLPTNSSRKRKALVSGITSGTVVVLFIIIIFIWRRKRHTGLYEDEDLRGLSVKLTTFSFGELKAATEDFSAANKLGEGGFGPVYKGKLADGRLVAVKQLSVVSLQGKRQFVTEVATISAVKHKHLVKLYGCCYEGNNRLLVYEFLENNSLDHALFGKSGLYLDWPARYSICVGTARGLAYLHEESRLRIVHRDIKASNILLDLDLTPKISDFGLAKLYDDKKTHISTRVAGTVGYLAPEYALRGHLTEKADVYGFGVLVLEILTGRPNTGSVSTVEGERIYLLDWAWLLHDNNCDLDMLDKKLPSFSKEEAVRMIQVAFLCTQTNPVQRPSMSRVVAMLAGEVETGDVTSRPVYLTEWRYDECSSFLTGTTTTDYEDTS